MELAIASNLASLWRRASSVRRRSVDVHGYGENGVWLSVRAAQHADGVANPDVGPVRPDIAFLDLEGLALLRQALELDEIRRKIVRMGDILHAQGQEFLARAADDLAISRIRRHEAAGEIGLAEAGGGLLEHRGEMRLALT